MILEELIKKNKVPTLFIGSGISKRYLKDYPNWYELLKRIAEKLGINKIQLNAIKQEIIRNKNISNNNEANPFIADELTKRLNELIIKDSNFTKNIFTKEEIDELCSYQCDYFKYLVCKEFKEYIIKEEKRFEIDAFIRATRKVGTVITTNYDSFLEDVIFTNFSVKSQQNQLYFVDNYEYETLYKIHGTYQNSNSIIINTNDYNNLEENSRLFIAKIYNLLMNAPMIFMGYSMNDSDILDILSKFTECFDSNILSNIAKNIIIVEYKENEKNIKECQTYIKSTEKNIPVTVLQTDNFIEIYQYLEKIELFLLPSEVNRYRKVLSKLLQDNERGLNKIKVLGDDSILEVDPSKMVVAIGENNVISKIQEYGVIGISFNEIVKKVLFQEEINVNLIVEKWCTENIQDKYNIPSFYLSKKYEGNFKEQLKFYNNYIYLSRKFEKKKDKMIKLKLEISIEDLFLIKNKNEITSNEYRQLFIAYFQTKINSEQLRDILKSVYINNNLEIKKTAFKELVCLLDYPF